MANLTPAPELTSAQLKREHSACPHDCPSTCALEVEKIDSYTIGRIYGADNSYTAGVVCAKVARYAERIHHPDRLAQPLRRVNSKSAGKGRYEVVSWDSALDIVASQLQHVINTDGAEAIWPYHYAGTMGLVQRDSIECFRHCLGTSLQHSTFCTTLADAGWIAGTGAKRGSDSRLIAESDLIVVWGGNPVSTQVNLMHHIAVARKRGAKLVVVDPYVTATAKVADTHLMLKPGTDAALACAVMHVLLSESLVDLDYLANYTDFDPDIRLHLESKTPQWASEITGLSTDEIIAFARHYGKTTKSFIRAGYGFSRSRNGAVSMHAVTCLPAMTGAWRYRGGGALYNNSAIYPVDRTVIQGLDKKTDGTRVLDQSRIGQVLAGNPRDLQGGPPISALFVQSTNPAVVAPESALVCEGLKRNDLFVCVHEQFMTDTAQYADIVLPATMFLEHDDLYVASGHTHIQMTKKIVEPFAETRSNQQVLGDIARRLGVDHKGFNHTAWELCDNALKTSGLPDAETLYQKHWHDCGLEFESENFLNGFDTDDGKFHFEPEWERLGPGGSAMPCYPDYWDVTDNTSGAYPLRLVAAPARQFLNTTFTETASSVKREGKPTLLMHPEMMQRLNLVSDQKISITSQTSSIIAHIRSFDGLQKEVVIMESIWPNSAFENGVGINALISAEPGYPNGGAVFHDTAVSVTGL